MRRIVLLLFLLTAACTSPEQVRDNVLHELEIKYNRKFSLDSIDMNHDEGNWGSASLLVYPSDDESLKFHVNYNYSDMKLTWEEYKGALWNREMAVYCSSLLRIPPRDIKTLITSNNSIVFNSMVLPFSTKFTDIISQVNRPRIGIEARIKHADFNKNAAILTETAESLLDLGFEKISITAFLTSGDGNKDILKFKITRRNNKPSADELKMLLQSVSSGTYKEAGRLYKTAAEEAAKGNKKEALKIYMNIIKKYDNPYRYDPYILFESHYVTESAYASAELLSEERNNAAASLYRLAAERLEYHEVKADLYEIYKKAVEKSERR